MPASVLPVTAETSDGAALPVTQWTGKWIGVEGTALTVAAGSSPARRLLTIVSLDGTDVYDGTVIGTNITFVRAGKTETIGSGSGPDTGLKYLDTEGNCLIVKPGEGYCRPRAENGG